MGKFYKKSGNSFESADTAVISSDFQINSEDKDKYTFPISEWYWFETEEEMVVDFGIKIINNNI